MASYYTRGEDIMMEMLLTQYQNSSNLKEYIMAYVAEMDLLFGAIHDVYQGRMLENAVGEQLDIIGLILDQPRNIGIPAEPYQVTHNGIDVVFNDVTVIHPINSNVTYNVLHNGTVITFGGQDVMYYQ